MKEHRSSMGREELPIREAKSELEAAFRECGRVVVQAPTGSGKSTQVPQYLLDAGLAGAGQIVVLQPRRLAARVLARRVAEERGGVVGAEVGYQVRFESHVGPHTRIRYVTEGVLLRELLEDRELRRAAVVLFDEFHERHLQGDLCLAAALALQRGPRPDLKIGVMSATLQAEALRVYLEPCRSVVSEGRMYPVEVEYAARPVREEVWDAAAEAWERVAAEEPEGDVLVFMPGGYEIQRTLAAIGQRRAAACWELHGLHAELPPAQQDAALRPGGKRKVIVSTNVAETSLTIPGIRAVIDGGLARVARFDPRRGIDTLFIEKISRASAEQRAGRAGRTGPGRCVRLWMEDEHRARAVEEVAEVRRVDLAEPLLTLAGAGFIEGGDWRAFGWFEAPPAAAAERAVVLLRDLGALDAAGHVTEAGRGMLKFPVHPRFSRMLQEAGRRGCVRPVAVIAALSQGREILLSKVDKGARERREELLGGDATSDFFLEMRALRYAEREEFDPRACARLGVHAGSARQAAQVARRFLSIAERSGLPLEGAGREAEVRRCVLAGFADQVGRRLDGGTLRVALVHGRKGELARASVVREARLLVAAEIAEIEHGSGGVDVLLGRVTAVEPEWLQEMFPGAVSAGEEVAFDPGMRRVMARRSRRYHDLVLEEGALVEAPAEPAARLLAEQVREGTCPLKQWDEGVEAWITRVNCLGAWRPDWELPRIGEEERRTIIEEICHGAAGYKDIKDKPVLPVVRGWLSGAQQALVEQEAPERVKLPSGRMGKVRYEEGKDPVLSGRIQDLYGLQEAPKLAGGSVAPVVEILAPNWRPVQVTRDLRSFWSEAYPKLKAELKRRYPKHEWR